MVKLLILLRNISSYSSLTAITSEAVAKISLFSLTEQKQSDYFVGKWSFSPQKIKKQTELPLYQLHLFNFAFIIPYRKQMMRHTIFFIATLLLVCCNRTAPTLSIEGYNMAVTAVETEKAPEQLRLHIENGRKAVDSIKAPVIGTASSALTMRIDESRNSYTTTLMNFAADALLHEAQLQSNEKIDLAITNKGGLRSELEKGEITFGDIYNIFPFENTLVVMTLNGSQILQLFNEVVKKRGEAVSGAKIVFSAPENGISYAKIDGKDVESQKEYRIATSDYLSQGNDGLTTLSQGYDRKEFSVTIRDLMIKHISDLHKQGKCVEASTDGRIIQSTCQ